MKRRCTTRTTSSSTIDLSISSRPTRRLATKSLTRLQTLKTVKPPITDSQIEVNNIDGNEETCSKPRRRGRSAKISIEKLDPQQIHDQEQQAKPLKAKGISKASKKTTEKETKPKRPTKSSKLVKGSENAAKDNQEENRHFKAYEKEETYLCELFEKLIDKNNSNSILISGDAGVGKTTLVESCLAKFPLLRDHSSEIIHDTKGRKGVGSKRLQDRQLKAVVFRFDGHLHGKNEPALLRQIGKRLNEFFDKEEQIFVDDLDESFDGHEDDEGEAVNLKVSRSIPKIMNLFRTLVDRVSTFRAVIILDQFEMFCSKQQHLLYNLFDLIQYGKGVLIIGITRVLECYQLLISRVQSRLNQRYIHLSPPLSSIEKYREFCELQIKELARKNSHVFENFADRENFDQEIMRNFSLSKCFADAKKFVYQWGFVPKTDGKPLNTVALKRDTKIIDLINLTRNQLVVLLVANKSMRSIDVEVFNPRDLYQWSVNVQCMKQFRFKQLIKCVYIMLELDLVIYAKENRKKEQLSLTPWTKLKLNISDFQLMELIENVGSKLPTYIKQLIH